MRYVVSDVSPPLWSFTALLGLLDTCLDHPRQTTDVFRPVRCDLDSRMPKQSKRALQTHDARWTRRLLTSTPAAIRSASQADEASP
eukprot:1236840-Prymnesium_polylepis.1